MIDRIKKIMEHYQLTPGSFADFIEISRPVISHLLTGRNKPSLEVVQKTGLKFSEISADWLLFGKGEMLKKESFSENEPTALNRNDESEITAPAAASTKKVQSELNTRQPDSNLNSSTKRIKAIMLIFDDHTFREIKPE